MYGLIGKMLTVEGKRDEVLDILLKATGRMPGCHSYIVAKDVTDANAIWITRCGTPRRPRRVVVAAGGEGGDRKARPLIAGFGDSVRQTRLVDVGLV